MCSFNRQLWLSIKLMVVPFLLCFASGCMNPYYGSYGYGVPNSRGYGQPNYAPMPSYNSAPGSLVIPEGSGDPYLPTTPGTYESDPPKDDFQRDKFYGTDGDGVPQPQDLRDQLRNNDLGRPQAMNSPSGVSFETNSGIQQVSGTRQMPADSGIRQLAFPTDNEYGFDTNEYRSLTGVLRYDSRSGGWAVTYSLKASDRYAGTLSLDLTAQQAQGLSEGDNVDIFGYVDDSVEDRNGRPIYRVSSISQI